MEGQFISVWWALGITITLVGSLTTVVAIMIRLAFMKLIDRMDKSDRQMEIMTGVNLLICNHLSDDPKFEKELDRFYTTVNAAKG